MFGLEVGNFLSSFLEFLYEQCSLHITEKIPSSVKFGSRPRIFLIRSNSSDVRPCRLISSGVTTGSRSEEPTSELQSQSNLVCRLLLEKKTEHKTPGQRRLATTTPGPTGRL